MQDNAANTNQRTPRWFKCVEDQCRIQTHLHAKDAPNFVINLGLNPSAAALIPTQNVFPHHIFHRAGCLPVAHSHNKRFFVHLVNTPLSDMARALK